MKHQTNKLESKEIMLTNGYIYAFIVSDQALEVFNEDYIYWVEYNGYTKLQRCFYIISFDDLRKAFDDTHHMCNKILEKEIKGSIIRRENDYYIDWIFDIKRRKDFMSYYGIFYYDGDELVSNIIEFNEFDYSDLPNFNVMCVKSTVLDCYNEGKVLSSKIPKYKINRFYENYNLSMMISIYFKDYTNIPNYYKKTRVRYTAEIVLKKRI